MSRRSSMYYPAYACTAGLAPAARVWQKFHVCFLSVVAMVVSATRHCRSFAGAKWLATSFFSHFSTAVAQPGIDVTNPADAVFVTEADLDLLNWDQPSAPGHAWKQSVQTALKAISLEDRYRLCRQRCSQSLASVGIYDAGMHRSPQAQCLAASVFCKCVPQCCS